MTARDPIYAGYRYPAEIISYGVWLYFRFPLSLRMVKVLAARGISVTHETIRQRVVDQDGFVLAALVQSRRDKKVAKHLFASSSRSRVEPLVCSSPTS